MIFIINIKNDIISLARYKKLLKNLYCFVEDKLNEIDGFDRKEVPVVLEKICNHYEIKIEYLSLNKCVEKNIFNTKISEICVFLNHVDKNFHLKKST